jgi:alanine racemase
MTALVIQKDLIVENYTALCSGTGVCVIPVLKGNGYGAGADELARLLWDAGARLFAVSRLEEALRLKTTLPEAEVLLLTPYGAEEDVEKIVESGITATVGSYDSAVVLNGVAERRGVNCRVHLKFDTGMGRFGFLPQDAEKAAQAAKFLTNLEVCGCFTHLANCFGKRRKNPMAQLALFKSCLNTLEKAGIKPGLTHIANSNGALLYPELRLDAVRCGSALLGRAGVKGHIKLSRVGYLESTVCDTRWLPAGKTVGYANTYKTKKPTRIAVVPVGYADGLFTGKLTDAFRARDTLRDGFHDFKRLFGAGRLFCRINGKEVPLVGRVGMCNVVVDVSEIDCKAGDTAVFDVSPLLINADLPRKYI